MKKSVLLTKIQEAYIKLDEAFDELGTAKRDLESTRGLVGDAFDKLVGLPSDAAEIEDDEPSENKEDDA